jgi:hypothetical protein
LTQLGYDNEKKKRALMILQDDYNKMKAADQTKINQLTACQRRIG